MAAKPEAEGVLIPVDFSGSADLPAAHVNQVLIQHTEHEFLITFYELLPPPISPDPARQAREIAKLKTIPARAVAKLVMSPGRARELVAALLENIETYDMRRQSQGEEQMP